MAKGEIPRLFPSFESKNVSEAKFLKTGTKFIISTTNERTHREVFYISEKLGRNTHPQRKGVGVLSNEEEHSKKVI